MSLTSALNSVGNGLATTQKLSQIASGNVSNALTPGYARREAAVVSGGPQHGASLVGEIRREVDTSLVRMSRLETAKMTRHQAMHEGLRDYSIFLGKPGDGISAADQFSKFRSAMTTLVNTPASTGAQLSAVGAAENLVRSVRETSAALNTLRVDVDMEIRYEVAELNEALYDLSRMNQQKNLAYDGTLEDALFEDQMSGIIDKVAEIVDVRVSFNSDGLVNIYTTGGAALIEGHLVQDVTFDAGSGQLLAGDVDITPGVDGVRGVEQGSLAGLSELKQEVIPTFQLQLDEYARGLITAFETSDTSLAPGQASLFTDNGSPLDPTDTDGLASRLQVNDAIKLNKGGEPWRIRDGLGAVSEGDPSDSSQLQSFLDALNDPMSADPDTGIPTSTSVADFASEFISSQQVVSARAEADLNAASSALDIVMSARENYEGVNIDEEMQQLILIEQSFSANSRVLTVVAEMIDTLINAF